ncbi:MAG TPA: hypothetical protein VKU89_03185 [Solirubrobacteraceae bacterium]|nr:hypothetical protein [Solirubrobacteraceae bacterium]
MLLRALVAFALITPLVFAAKLALSPLAGTPRAVVGVALYVSFLFW